MQPTLRYPDDALRALRPQDVARLNRELCDHQHEYTRQTLLANGGFSVGTYCIHQLRLKYRARALRRSEQRQGQPPRQPPPAATVALTAAPGLSRLAQATASGVEQLS